MVDAKSGATGAGRTLREDLLFCELAEDFSAYSPGRSHRHVGEMETVLAERTGQRVSLDLLPAPPAREARHPVRPLPEDGKRGPRSCARALRTFYQGSPFVGSWTRPPRLSHVVGTNDCRISVHAAAPGRAVVFSALDNLGKGAAGQAIQNLNLAMGWRESAGLPVTGTSP